VIPFINQFTEDIEMINVTLKDGSIIEEGNHEELVKKGGYYSELVKLQVGDIAEATEILSEKSAKTQEGGVVNG